MKLTKIDQTQFNNLVHQILEFRNTFDLDVNWAGSLDYLKTNVELHDALHLEELKELALAPNKIEAIDALGDMMYVIMGRLVEAGIGYLQDAQVHFPASVDWLNYLITVGDDILETEGGMFKAFDLIHLSNMTKTCTEQQVAENKAHYGEQGIYLEVEPKGSDCYVLKTARDYPEKNLKKGKVIKNIHYSAVDLSVLFDQPCIEK